MNYIPTQDLIQSTNKADKQAIQKHIELQIGNFKDEELVCIVKSIAKPTGDDAVTAAYYSAKNLRKQLPSLVNKWIEGNPKFLWICPNPVTNFQPRTYFAARPWHNKSNIIRWNCLILDFDRANDKEEPATLEQLSRIQQASSLVSQWLADSLGIRTALNAITGNGVALAIPIDLPQKNAPETQIKAFLAMLQDYLDMNGFGDVKVDDSYEKPMQAVGIIGSINGKFQEPRLRCFIDPSEIQDWESIRENNSQMLLLQMARISLKDSVDLPNLVNKKEENNARFAQVAQAIEDFNSSTSWLSILEHRGFKLIRDFGHYQMWQRPMKEGKSVSLVCGSNKGGKDRLWCYSTSCEIPAGKSLSKYWVELILSGIAGSDFKIRNEERRRDFLRKIGAFDQKANYEWKGEETTSSCEQEQEPVQVAQAMDGEILDSEESKGTLDGIELPAAINEIKNSIESNQPYHSETISKAFAVGSFSFMVGKSVRVGRMPLSTYHNILADSGVGKEAGKGFISDLFDVPASDFKGLTQEEVKLLKDQKDFSIQSGVGLTNSTAQGLAKSFSINGRVWYFLNEGASFVFEDAKENPHTSNLRAMFLDIYTGGSIGKRELAEETIEGVKHTFASFTMTCTRRSFFRNLTYEKIQNGFCNRCITVMQTRKGLSKLQSQLMGGFNPSQELLDMHAYWRLQNLAGYKEWESEYEKNQDMRGTGLGNWHPKRNIGVSGSLERKIKEYADSLVIKERKGELDDLTANLAIRLNENAIRLAALFTLADDREAVEISLPAWDLAVKYVQFSNQTMLLGRESNQSLPDQQEAYILEKVQRSGTAGITPRDLAKGAKRNHLFASDGSKVSTTEIIKRILRNLEDNGFIYGINATNSVRYFAR